MPNPPPVLRVRGWGEGRTADVAAAKRQLLQRIAGTQRGAAATRMDRGFIAESQVGPVSARVLLRGSV